MTDLVNISAGNALTVAVLGYAIVFAGLILLMAVVMLCGRLMSQGQEKPKAGTPAPKAAAPAPQPQVSASSAPVPAPGSAGKLKLYNTAPKDAAMIMAIVADKMGKPLNELRFLSIREVDSGK